MVAEGAISRTESVMSTAQRTAVDPASVTFLGVMEGTAVWAGVTDRGAVCSLVPDGGYAVCSQGPQDRVELPLTFGDAQATAYLSLADGRPVLQFDVAPRALTGDAVTPLRRAVADRLGVDELGLTPMMQLGAIRVWAMVEVSRRCAIVTTATMDPPMLLAAEPICVQGDEELRLISAAAGLVDAPTGTAFEPGLDAADQDVWFSWPEDGVLTISTRPIQ